MSAVFTEDDIGKAVETDAGEALGVVVDVDPETAYVEPAEGAVDSTRAVLDWEESGEEAVPLTDDAVDRVTDEAIRLESDFSPESITSGSTAETERPDEGDVAEAGEPGGSSESGGVDTAAGADPDDVDFAPGEPVASNPTEPETDIEGTSGVGETGELDDTEPMMEDDEFYDDADDEARVDPDDEMAAPDDETASPTEYDESEAAADAEGTAVEDSDSTDREDVDVDPDEVTAGDPEAEIEDEEDVR